MGWRGRLRAAASSLGIEGVLDRSRRWMLALDPRRLARAAAFRRLNRGAAADEIVLRPALRVRIDPRSREPFEHFCFRSPEMAAELDAFLGRAAAGGCLLDVGACHGVFSLAFVLGRPGARALAVEPSPPAFEILAGNVLKNAADRVELAQVALGGGTSTVRMRRSWHHLEALGEDQVEADAVTLPVRSLDDLCAERRFRPSLIKVDVEGFEHAVLLGARGVLERERPQLFLEIHPRRLAELGSSTREVIELLAERRYEPRALSGRRLSPRRLAARERVFRLLCTPLSG